ncbi:MAG: hypothetical protein ASARMPRED_002769 [Alectoria sarmentosa]|nr:MAG: hypothetical protein ASARMPRED_002769 [Alectoria sarmentosa]
MQEAHTLAQRKADKDRWWQIRFCVTWFYPDAECLDAFFLFRDIATNRRLQRYPKEVTFRDRDFTGHRVSPFVALEMKDQVVQACNTVFKDLESPYIAKDEMDTLYNKLIDVEGSVSRGECSLDATHLGSLLERVECLRVFSYDHATLRRPVPVGKAVSPGALLGLVLQHARTSLTYLKFTTDAEDSETMGAVGPFRGFEALKITRLSSVMLMEDDQWVLKKLVDELPASLEELELVEEASPEEAQSMFAGMLEMKRERLPNLRYVVFEGRIPFDEGTIEAYERAGVMLDWRINDYSNTRYSRFFKTDREVFDKKAKTGDPAGIYIAIRMIRGRAP